MNQPVDAMPTADMLHAGDQHGGPAHRDHDMAVMAGMHASANFTPGSGTSRLPAGEGGMHGLHLMAGDWMMMAHGYAWAVHTDQGGPRGRAMNFVQSMAMMEASRDLDDRTDLAIRAMLSLDPLIGDRGYPNLFATGETAGGVPLVDRQHPHDFFMELSARVSHEIGAGTRAFVYAGLPGEPAIGPSAFMHRASSRLNPEAPITHHWFDSTHISFGVVTAGLSTARWQIEASAFNGREPGENRWNVERPRLDSWAARATWSPSPRWSASLSYAELNAPERLHPERDERRMIATISYAAPGLAVTGGAAVKDVQPGRTLDAQFVEATWEVATRHALFGRVERVRNDELFEADQASPLHDRAFHVAKLTGGYGYTLPVGKAASLALGGTASVYAKPGRLDAAYGRDPVSLSVFAKLSLGH